MTHEHAIIGGDLERARGIGNWIAATEIAALRSIFFLLIGDFICT